MTISTRALSTVGIRQRVVQFQAEEEHKLGRLLEQMASRIATAFGGDAIAIRNAMADVVSRGEVFEVLEEDLPVALFGLVVEPQRVLFLTMAIDETVSFKVLREPITEIDQRALRVPGVRKLVAEASPSQAAFLKEAGFRVVGRLTEERLIDGRWEDIVLLERLANAPAPTMRTTVKQDVQKVEEEFANVAEYDEDEEDDDDAVRPPAKPKKRDTGLVDRQSLRKADRNDLYAELGLNPNEVGDEEAPASPAPKPKVQRWDPLAGNQQKSFIVR